MWVYVDESGDPGFKFDHGSTSHFVVALVIFDEPTHIERTERVIARLRERLGVKETFEFKFNKLKHEWREDFLKAVRYSPFRIRAMVVDKRILRSARLHKKGIFYNYFVGQVFKHHFGSLKGAKVRVDGQSGREFRREFSTYVRKKAGGAVAGIRFLDSKSNGLIQLADMVAGAIHRAYRDDEKNDPRYLRLLWPRIEDLWEFDITKRPGT